MCPSAPRVCWPGCFPEAHPGNEPRSLARLRWHATATPFSQHIFVLNVALWNMWQVHFWITEFDLLASCEVSKSRDLGLNFSNRSEIWHALRQHYPYPGWSSVHWNATRMPLVDPVYTGTPLEKLSWNSPTLECHWRILVESAPHWDATGETLTFTAYTGTPLDGLCQPTPAPTHIV